MRRRAAVLTLLTLAGAALPAAAEPVGDLRIRIEQPDVSSPVADGDGTAFIAGRAVGFRGRSERFDVVIAIDTSRSTAAPAGVDVDRDGICGAAAPGRFSDRMSSDPGDSVLAAQVAAARTLLAQIDPELSRVALVTFAGDSLGDQPPARVEVPLTHDFAALQSALDEVVLQTPRGRTHIAAALELAGNELLGRSGARSTARVGATRVLVLMTDGQPTLPFALDPAANVEHTLAAARRLAAAHIRIDAFALGGAQDGSRFSAALAAQTGGRFSEVSDPRELMADLDQLRVASLSGLEIVNETTGESAIAKSVEGDGRFFALMPVATGENRLRIRARADDGSSAEHTLRVVGLADASAAALNPRWLEPRRRLLQNGLWELRQKRVALEAEQAVRARREALRAMKRVRTERARSVRIEQSGLRESQ